MTTDEIASTMKKIFERQAELKELSSQRQAEENALIIEYRVDECNQKRNSLILKYRDLSLQAQQDIITLQESLGAK